MFADIESDDFFVFVDSDSSKYGSDHRPEDQGGNDGDNSKRQRTNELNAKLGKAVAGEEALAGVEQAHCQGSPGTAGAMNRESSHRVINLKVVNQCNGKHNDDSTDESHHPGRGH